MTVKETTERIWSEGVRQLRAVSTNGMTSKETRIQGINLRQYTDILQHTSPIETEDQWKRARLCFDEGVRGNPEPGGSGWVLLKEARQRGNGRFRGANTCIRALMSPTTSASMRPYAPASLRHRQHSKAATLTSRSSGKQPHHRETDGQSTSRIQLHQADCRSHQDPEQLLWVDHLHASHKRPQHHG